MANGIVHVAWCEHDLQPDRRTRGAVMRSVERTTLTRLAALQSALHDAQHVLIVPHTNPDPDAIASAVAVRELLIRQFAIPAQVGYQGVIGRAENRALVRYLGHPLRRIRAADVRNADVVVLVDTQPGAGNCKLPANTALRAVIDHHPLRGGCTPGAFVDVRPAVGATSTILTEYLQAADLALEPTLATALLYGITSDTGCLTRGAHAADVAAYLFLQPQIDPVALLEIEQAQVPAAYFRQLTAAIQAARVHDDVIIADVGPVAYPDFPAELADLLMRLAGMKWSICIGLYAGTAIFSVRTRHVRGGAGRLVQAVVADAGTAGGHELFAGGQVPLCGRSASEMTTTIAQRLLLQLHKASVPGVPLIADQRTVQMANGITPEQVDDAVRGG